MQNAQRVRRALDEQQLLGRGARLDICLSPAAFYGFIARAVQKEHRYRRPCQRVGSRLLKVDAQKQPRQHLLRGQHDFRDMVFMRVAAHLLIDAVEAAVYHRSLNACAPQLVGSVGNRGGSHGYAVEQNLLRAKLLRPACPRKHVVLLAQTDGRPAAAAFAVRALTGDQHVEAALIQEPRVRRNVGVHLRADAVKQDRGARRTPVVIIAQQPQPVIRVLPNARVRLGLYPLPRRGDPA